MVLLGLLGAGVSFSIAAQGKAGSVAKTKAGSSTRKQKVNDLK
jgi:hypothetical protein